MFLGNIFIYLPSYVLSRPWRYYFDISFSKITNPTKGRKEEKKKNENKNEFTYTPRFSKNRPP